MPTGPVSVGLVAVDDSGKRVDAAPDGVGIGELCLLQWQIHPAGRPTGQFTGSAVYLVKVNYELRLRPDLAPMRWFELGLRFCSGESTTVVAAVPRSSRGPQEAASYAVTDYLELVRTEPGAARDLHLPEIDDSIRLYEVPGSSVRWQHRSDHPDGVEPGSRSAWLVLLVPEGQDRVSVELSARYDLRTSEDAPYRPVQEPAEFVITLRQEDFAPKVIPVAADRRPALEEGEPSAFVCYAHDSPEHKANVRRFADILIDAGIDVRIDQYDPPTRKDWAHWAYEHLRRRDFVLVMASAMCKAVGDGDAEPGLHLGLDSELNALRTLYQRNPQWRQYVLPVVLPEWTEFDLPLFLAPATMDYVPVLDYTSGGVADLLETMRSTEFRTWEPR